MIQPEVVKRKSIGNWYDEDDEPVDYELLSKQVDISNTNEKTTETELKTNQSVLSNNSTITPEESKIDKSNINPQNTNPQVKKYEPPQSVIIKKRPEQVSKSSINQTEYQSGNNNGDLHEKSTQKNSDNYTSDKSSSNQNSNKPKSHNDGYRERPSKERYDKPNRDLSYTDNHHKPMVNDHYNSDQIDNYDKPTTNNRQKSSATYGTDKTDNRGAKDSASLYRPTASRNVDTRENRDPIQSHEPQREKDKGDLYKSQQDYQSYCMRPVRDLEWETPPIENDYERAENKNHTRNDRASSTPYNPKIGYSTQSDYYTETKDRDYIHKNYHNDQPVSKFKEEKNRNYNPSKVNNSYPTNYTSHEHSKFNNKHNISTKSEPSIEQKGSNKDYPKKYNNTEEPMKSKPHWRARDQHNQNGDNGNYPEEYNDSENPTEYKKRVAPNPPKKQLYRTKASLLEISQEETQ